MLETFPKEKKVPKHSKLTPDSCQQELKSPNLQSKKGDISKTFPKKEGRKKFQLKTYENLPI
ncbi:hypothetical protein RhiirA4_412876 [Rhizophagus irregularis]|uniref:Uncharacterized protein n=1 Tax=Rhizophagus irregularis TaxID=588596 RepID=A0A2I1HQE8_9GLOM|nr:hypothetical protein RhiirA4_409737 [Rhizophagus irregularis]PKY61023.1 hypothetical protein RhiirA4_412864 [Rhizophagus irregularis]PKY61087.1 hypothetical protein RhiirA4_412876 [Rhizophagus irregularis]